MFTSEIMNSSAELKYLLQAINDTNVSEVLLTNGTNGSTLKNLNLFRETFLMGMILISAVGHLVALCFNYYRFNWYGREKRVLWLCTTHILFIGSLVGYVPLMAQVSFETGNYSMFLWDILSCENLRYMKNYFLFLTSYILITLVLVCYHLVIRPLFTTPVSVFKLYVFMFVLYVFGQVPSILIRLVQNCPNGTEGTCTPYFFPPMEYQHHSNKFSMALTLLFIYVVPIGVIVVLFSKILYKLKTKGYKNDKPILSLMISDYKFIRMTLWMSVLYIIANVPFVIQAVIIKYIDSSLIDPDVAVLVEILSIANTCLNPYVYLLVEENDLLCSPINCLFDCLSWCFKYKPNNKVYHGENSFHKASQCHESGLLCCFDSAASNAYKDSKPIDKLCQTEAIPMLFKT